MGNKKKRKDGYQLLFPSPIWRSYGLISAEENNKISEHIIQNKDEVHNSTVEWLSGSQSPTNSFGAEKIVRDHPIFTNLLNSIDNQLRKFADTLKFKTDELSKRDWWWNVYEDPNQYQEFHSHTPNYFSAVYFCKAPDGSAPLTFRPPNFNQWRGYHYEKNQFNADIETIEPVERSLVIFPSDLIHCVTGGSNTEPRITIALNYG